MSLSCSALKDGALGPILYLCLMREEVALLAVKTLALIVEQQENINTVIEVSWRHILIKRMKAKNNVILLSM